jgi:hypothetical protein
MKNLAATLLILLCPLVLNTCDLDIPDMDDFPPVEWEMGYIDTSAFDSDGIVCIAFQPSRDFKGKTIGYYEDYSDTRRALDAHRLVYINGKSPSGRGGRGWAGGTFNRIGIFPDEPLQTGDVITFYRDWCVMNVSEGGGFNFDKYDWYKVRIITESLIAP